MGAVRMRCIPALLGVFGYGLSLPVQSSAQSGVDLVAEAVRPLPDDLRDGATVFRYEADTGLREVLRQGTNHVECAPQDERAFTRCWPTASASWRDLRARLSAEGVPADEIGARMEAAVAAGEVEAPAFGSLSYRLYADGDRIQLLWIVLVPGASARDLAMPTASQRGNALIGRGTPWMMNEGTPGAHLMIPINGTALSNAGHPAPLLDAHAMEDPIAQATLPLPNDLKDGATVSTLDSETGERTILREGSNGVECRPRNPETGYTRCYHESVWLGRDLAAQLRAEERTEEEVADEMARAQADGRVQPTTFGSLAYRLFEEDNRIRLLWMVRVPGATAAELGMPTGSQRNAALEGRGTPWMMNEGTAGAHLMIPINGTALSNRE